MEDLVRRAIRPGSALERVLRRLADGAANDYEPYPTNDASGRPFDHSLCPDCFRLYDRSCKTCGGDRHRDGMRGRVCPDCGGQRVVPVAIRGARTTDLTPCGSCTVPKETDDGRLIKTRGVPAYTYRRDLELVRIAEWQDRNQSRVRQVKHALRFDSASAEYRAACPYPVIDPIDDDLDLDDPSIPFD